MRDNSDTDRLTWHVNLTWGWNRKREDMGANHIHIRSSHTVLGLMPLIPYSDLIYTAKVTHTSFPHNTMEALSVWNQTFLSLDSTLNQFFGVAETPCCFSPRHLRGHVPFCLLQVILLRKPLSESVISASCALLKPAYRFYLRLVKLYLGKSWKRSNLTSILCSLRLIKNNAVSLCGLCESIHWIDWQTWS